MATDDNRPHIIKVICPKTDWPLSVHVEAQHDVSEVILPGASIPPEKVSDGKWCLTHFCPYCLTTHEFEVEPDYTPGVDDTGSQVPKPREKGMDTYRPVIAR